MLKLPLSTGNYKSKGNTCVNEGVHFPGMVYVYSTYIFIIMTTTMGYRNQGLEPKSFSYCLVLNRTSIIF